LGLSGNEFLLGRQSAVGAQFRRRKVPLTAHRQRQRWGNVIAMEQPTNEKEKEK
jgi:hypothetical protein